MTACHTIAAPVQAVIYDGTNTHELRALLPGHVSIAPGADPAVIVVLEAGQDDRTMKPGWGVTVTRDGVTTVHSPRAFATWVRADDS